MRPSTPETNVRSMGDNRRVVSRTRLKDPAIPERTFPKRSRTRGPRTEHMRSDLDRRDEFLLRGSTQTAARLTYHIDMLRDRLTAFFVTVTGIAVAGLSIVVKDDAGPDAVSLALAVAAALFFVVAVLGALVVSILARLRRAQIEHFRIMNNIREHFLGEQDLSLWNVVELSRATLPTPNRRSGTFMWLTMILVMSAFAAGLAVYVVMRELINDASDGLTWGPCGRCGSGFASDPSGALSRSREGARAPRLWRCRSHRLHGRR